MKSGGKFHVEDLPVLICVLLIWHAHTCPAEAGITDAWAEKGSLAYPRSSHTATLLPNGKVPAAGGYNHNEDYLSNCELYISQTAH